MRCCRRVVLIVTAAYALKQLRESEMESFAESKVAECEATGCTKLKRAHTHVYVHTPLKKTSAVAVTCYLVSHFSVKLQEQTAHESILKLKATCLKIDLCLDLCTCNDGVMPFDTCLQSETRVGHVE